MPPELTADIERVVPSPVQLCNEAVELIADDRNLAAKRLRAAPGVSGRPASCSRCSFLRQPFLHPSHVLFQCLSG